MRRRKQHYPAGFVDWMTGYCDAFDDLPDGAWQAACENAVEAYNDEHGTGIDPFDGWMHWVSKTSVKETP